MLAAGKKAEEAGKRGGLHLGGHPGENRFFLVLPLGRKEPWEGGDRPSSKL